MENNLNILNEIRMKYSEFLIEVGMQSIEMFPDINLNEFVDNYLPPREDVLEILIKEKAKNLNRIGSLLFFFKLKL